MTSQIPLPSPLILLIHLHLLNYPHANNAEYDQDMFNPRVRGLRERTKTMEDVSYFLVGMLEGNSDKAKRILPTYPCFLPSDTMTFRASLAKYFENLRHMALRNNQEHTKIDSVNNASTSDMDSWWWRDVVVRKSLLEECSGERFERILLSLSTHVLLKYQRDCSSSFSQPTQTTDVKTRSDTYASCLLSAQATRKEWERVALLLIEQQEHMQALRDRLTSGQDESSIYSTLSTDRQIALADSKLLDVSSALWTGTGGQHAFDFLSKLAGLKTARARDAATELVPQQAYSKPDFYQTPPVCHEPLPVAAAHHPSNIRKLVTDPLSSVKKKRKKDATSNPNHGGSEQRYSAAMHASIFVSTHMDNEGRVQKVLETALARAEGINVALNRRMSEHDSTNADREPGSVYLRQDSTSILQESLDFKKPPSAELLAAFSFTTPPSPSGLANRIDEIRNNLLPTYPPLERVSAQIHRRISSVDSRSRLPRPTTKSPAASHIASPTAVRAPRLHNLQSPKPPSITPPPPQTPRQLLTSTPPQTVKPRSAYVRRVLAAENGRGKKGIRDSIVRASRPSLFEFPPENADSMIMDEDADEINRIVELVQDDSFSDPEDCSYVTPGSNKLTKFPSSVIFTRPGGGGFPTPRPSLDNEEGLELLSLPVDTNSLEEDNTRSRPDMEEDEFYCEGVSMTLRDILLGAADVTQFDLLGENQADFADESHIWG